MGTIMDIISPNYEQDQADIKFIRKKSSEKLLLLLNKKEFQEYLVEVRKLINLKDTLNPETDFIPEEPNSIFLADTFLNYSLRYKNKLNANSTAKEILELGLAIYSREPELEVYFELKMEEILNHFRLPYFYYDAIQYMILYGKVPDWDISFPFDFLIQITQNPSLVLTLDLSTTEKKMIRRFARHSFRIPGNGRIRDEKYLELLRHLKEKKNFSKINKNLERDIEISKKFTEDGSFYDGDKFILKTKNSKEITVEYESSDDRKVLEKKANNMRKIKQRIADKIDKV